MHVPNIYLGLMGVLLLVQAAAEEGLLFRSNGWLSPTLISVNILPGNRLDRFCWLTVLPIFRIS